MNSNHWKAVCAGTIGTVVALNVFLSNIAPQFPTVKWLQAAAVIVAGAYQVTQHWRDGERIKAAALQGMSVSRNGVNN